MRPMAWLPALVLTLAHAAIAGENRVAFARRPSVSRAGDKVVISFAANRETDVAVYIEDAKGEVIRHLVAGVLGKNPPAPLKPDSLEQAVEWDGKADYGRPAEGGPFRVRLALGLGARYDKVVSSNRQNIVKVTGLGTGPDGTLYVLAATWGAVWEGPQVLAFSRDGVYQRMVMPFPTSLKSEQVRGITSLELDGRPAPLLHNIRMGLYPDFSTPCPCNVAVSPDGGRLYLPCFDHHGNVPPSIGMLDAEGGCPADKLVVAVGRAPRAGEGSGKRPMFAGFSCLAVSSDGKRLYAGGMKPHVYEKAEHCAVYRVKLPERNACEPLFGEPATPGKDEAHLGGAPRGLAVDGKGKLFIADHANDRVVVVNEKDGKFLGEVPVERPDYVGVDPRSGSLYVTRHAAGKGASVEVVKFSVPAGIKGAQEVCRAVARMARAEYSAAVDASAEPTVVWVGDRFGNLVRLEDGGATLNARVVSGGIEGYKSLPECYLAVAVDRLRKEVYARNSTGGGLWVRYSEATDALEQVRIPGDMFGGGKGFQVLPHPDGHLYGLRWPWCFYRYDRDGRPAPWDEPIAPTAAEAAIHGEANKPIPKDQLEWMRKQRNFSFVPVSMVELPHTLGIRESDGHLFVLSPTVRNRTCKVLHEYLPSGRRVTTDPILWKTSDAVVGPRFDAAGNIYVAEIVRPRGWLPPLLAEHFGRLGLKGLAGPAFVAANFYGSIVKFSPKGGMFQFSPGDVKSYLPDPFTGEPRLPAGLKTLDVEYLRGDSVKPATVIGAQWVHPGIGHVGLFGCNCENVTFDVDPFGRVFYPDVALYRVGVLDTNGNTIAHFGGYGNAESMGPDSPVVDPQSKKLRPRKPDDPKDLRSPFAEPEIAFAWLVGVGATDKFIYTGDSLNRRLMRLKMSYAAEETVPLP